MQKTRQNHGMFGDESLMEPWMIWVVSDRQTCWTLQPQSRRSFTFRVDDVCLVLAIFNIHHHFFLNSFEWSSMQVKPPKFWDCSTYIKLKTKTMCFVVTMATSFIARVVWVQHFPAMTTTRSQDSSTIPADSADSQLIKAWNEHVLQISSHFYRITFIYVSSKS